MAKIEINIQDQEKWFSLIQDINCRIVQNFTQGATAKYLGVSRKTIVDFEHGKIFDTRLLFAYAGLVGYSINFNLGSL
jgi:DNA-binding XRE family transcriptional regulator